ncbi:MAG: TonB-dependent receptor [Luteolibacter sp.]
MKFPLPIVYFFPLLLHAESTVPSQPVELGELVVQAMKPDISYQVDSKEARDLARQDLAETLAIIPGISLCRTGARAETGITLRGYDLRQVPVFIDGIPVYVPYDGYPDLGRFTIPEAGKIEVAKGISPVLAGPNDLGGLVNVYTRRPEKKLEGSVHAGVFSGGGEEAGLSAGGREEKFYWQFDLAWMKQDSFPLSDDFEPTATENGNSRENSWSEDWRASGRVAWTPSVDDEYTLGFWIQRGEKGTPPYTGNDPTISARFWQWPQWDKDTVYLLTKTALTEDTTLETKVHYDRFENTLAAYDDATYSTQTRRSSFTSFYDDWTAGASAQIDNRAFKNTRLSAALHYKVDHHEEMNAGAPKYTFEDTTGSLGFEVERVLPYNNTVTAGISRDWRKVDEAVDTNTGEDLGGETVDSWNPQVVLKHDFNDDLSAHAGVARKSRFPTIKDRYSYRMGQAIPNPDLEPETATHFDLGLDGRTPDARFDWSAGVYYSRVKDAIQRVDNVAFTSGGTGLFQLRNVGEVEHYGFEASANAKWTDRIETGIRYACNHAENRTDKNIYVTNTPENEVLLFSSLKLHEKFRVIPAFTWSDKRYVTSDGKETGIYQKVDIKAEASLPYGVTLGFGVTNLLDRNQELDEGFPEEGRGYFVDLRYEF